MDALVPVATGARWTVQSTWSGRSPWGIPGSATHDGRGHVAGPVTVADGRVDSVADGPVVSGPVVSGPV